MVSVIIEIITKLWWRARVSTSKWKSPKGLKEIFIAEIGAGRKNQ
jgi:hypothetical protein